MVCVARRLGIVACVVTACMVAASCSDSREVTTVDAADEAPTSTVPGGSVAPLGTDGPDWYLAGVESGRAKLAADRELRRPTVTAPPTTAPAPALPPRSQFVSALAGLGLGDASAGCIYDNLSAGGVVEDATAIFQILTATTGGGLPDASTISAISKLDAGTNKRLIVALSPCLDTATLLTLLAQTGGLGVDMDAVGSAGLAALVSSLSGTNLAALRASAPSLASTAGAQLPAAQLAALQAFLTSAAADTLGKLNLANFDISKLDLKNLSAQEIGLLFAALVRGLDANQQQQLQSLAKVDLARLGLQIDYSKLTTEQAGALLVLFLPFLSTTLDPAGGQLPAGWDPSQIYIPPDVDLSEINPLYFVPKENVVLGLEREGVSSKLAGCLYDELRLINPQLIGLAFAGDDITAAGQVLLAVFGCMLR